MVLTTNSLQGDKSEITMKLKCVRGAVTSQGVANVGDVVELSGQEAKVFLAHGKFVEVAEVAAKADPAVIQHRDPVIERGRKGASKP